MSEDDYQRGLRGGPERVSISDWDRWKDWKAGRDEYERAQDAELERSLMATSTPEENLARLNARLREIEEKEARWKTWRKETDEEDAARAAQQKASSDQAWNVVLIFFVLGAALGGWFLGSMTGGFIGFAIGVILGAVVGIFVGGVAVAFFFD